MVNDSPLKNILLIRISEGNGGRAIINGGPHHSAIQILIGANHILAYSLFFDRCY
jgi:hypothetical protein